MRHNWDPNDQQNWEMNCQAERKARPLRDYNGDILNTGDLVWLTNRVPNELALVIGESHRENVLVRYVKGGFDFTINEIDCEKVKKNEKKL